MVKIVGVRFRNAGKIYYFAPRDLELKAGDRVIVETARGIEYGTVVGGIRQMTDDEITQPLKEVIRKSTPEDDAQIARNSEREKEAMRICKEKIRKHGLDMKLIDAEYTFDNNKILFYFTADGRIDFRELVKDLASVFRTRIELRQIGVRDETKILGGIGICGRTLCCHSYLSDFVPVSIKMAKEQNLSLNPAKISGVCGRLMCCLKNEEETYEYLNSQLPSIGEHVTTASGLEGDVTSVSVLRQRVKVLIENGDSKEIQEYDVADLTFSQRRHKEHRDGDKQGHGDKQAHSEKQGHAEKQNHGDRPARGEKPNRGERPNRGENNGRADGAKSGDNQKRNDARDGADQRRERPRKKMRPAADAEMNSTSAVENKANPIPEASVQADGEHRRPRRRRRRGGEHRRPDQEGGAEGGSNE